MSEVGVETNFSKSNLDDSKSVAGILGGPCDSSIQEPGEIIVYILHISEKSLGNI